LQAEAVNNIFGPWERLYQSGFSGLEAWLTNSRGPRKGLTGRVESLLGRSPFREPYSPRAAPRESGPEFHGKMRERGEIL